MSAYPSPHKLLAAALTAGLLSVSAVRAQYSWSANFNDMLTPPGMMLRGNATMPIISGLSNTACLALTPAGRGMQGDVVLAKFWGDDEAPADVSVRFSLKFGGNNNGVLGDGCSVSIVKTTSSSPVIHQDGRIILAARTGDAFNAHLIDNLSVEVTPYPIFRQQPASQKVTSGTSVLFEAQTNFNTLPWRGIGTFNLVSSVTSEWQIRHPGGQWTAVPDTTNSLLWGADARPFKVFSNLREDRGLWEGDDPVWSIDGTEVRCVLTWHSGYTTATQPAVLRLMPQLQEFPGAITLWNAFPQGSAVVTFPHEEGKVLRLTPAEPDRSGGFVFDELANNNAGEPRLAESFIGTFQYRGSQASDPRADGFSFNLASDLAAAGLPAAGEEGAGTGLTISFDSYSNGPEDPTGIDVIWKGQRIARIPMAADELFSDDWRTFYVRIEFCGTLDLALNGEALVADLPLPGWSGIPSAKMAFYGRTGSFWQQQDVRELAVWFTATTVQHFIPELVIDRAAPNAIGLQWNVSPTELWELYESHDLVTWTKNTGTPIINGISRQLFIEMHQIRRFFRLQKSALSSP